MDPPFPTDEREFDGDDRISFSKLDNKFIAVHDDGTEYEFDNNTRGWHPIDEEELDGVGSIAPDGDSGSGASHLEDAASRKRKNGSHNGSEVSMSQTPYILAVIDLFFFSTGSRTVKTFEAEKEAKTTAATQAEHSSLRYRPAHRCDRRRSPRRLLAKSRRHCGRD
jgi:hypothetical protein